MADDQGLAASPRAVGGVGSRSLRNRVGPARPAHGRGKRGNGAGPPGNVAADKTAGSSPSSSRLRRCGMGSGLLGFRLVTRLVTTGLLHGAKLPSSWCAPWDSNPEPMD